MFVKDKNQEKFFQSLDIFQNNLFETLIETYNDDAFCKLIALKMSNFFASEYHFYHRHSIISSNPIQLLIDPFNGCQLRCPGCVHSANKSWYELFDWPKLALPFNRYSDFLDRFGIFASSAILYNYGEPLLYKRFPDMVRTAKEYLLFTMASTNFSLKFDVDALVLSGIDRLLLSIDGASQKTYQQYRRRGEFKTIIDNIVKIVEAKKRLGKDKPYLVWLYLTFEHNIDEVDKAIEMAEQLGVNEIFIYTPFDVSFDDPIIKVVTSPKQGQIVFKPFDTYCYTEEEKNAVSQRASHINAAFKESWRERVIKMGKMGKMDEPSRMTAPTCRWLYHNLTLDGASRIMPCCIAPEIKKGIKNLVYAQFENRDSEVINSKSAVLSRQAFADRSAFLASIANRDTTDLPYCVNCKEQPIPPYSFDVANYISAIDIKNVISPAIYTALNQCALYNK
jgi:MoaA/NifB/PqqE/SkfB family radical SAM enzyme